MFIVSSPALVIAQCQAGIVGSMPALNARTDTQLDEWLADIATALADYDRANPALPAAPFAINQIAHPSNDRLARDTEIIVKHRVPIVIISLSAHRDIVDAVHAYGGLVFNDVISDRHARKAIANGCDGLIAVAAGADLAYIGTPFIATVEANAVPEYKTMVAEARSADIVTTDYFSGVPANFLRGSIVRAGFDPSELRRDPNTATNVSPSGDSHKTWRDIWGCGHGVGAVSAIVPAATRVARLIAEYRAARVALAAV